MSAGLEDTDARFGRMSLGRPSLGRLSLNTSRRSFDSLGSPGPEAGQSRRRIARTLPQTPTPTDVGLSSQGSFCSFFSFLFLSVFFLRFPCAGPLLILWSHAFSTLWTKRTQLALTLRAQIKIKNLPFCLLHPSGSARVSLPLVSPLASFHYCFVRYLFRLQGGGNAQSPGSPKRGLSRHGFAAHGISRQ